MTRIILKNFAMCIERLSNYIHSRWTTKKPSRVKWFPDPSCPWSASAFGSLLEGIHNYAAGYKSIELDHLPKFLTKQNYNNLRERPFRIVWSPKEVGVAPKLLPTHIAVHRKSSFKGHYSPLCGMPESLGTPPFHTLWKTKPILNIMGTTLKI